MTVAYTTAWDMTPVDDGSGESVGLLTTARCVTRWP
jgi:hypothetical protein